MAAKLRLIVNHEHQQVTRRHDGGELRRLSQRLAQHIRWGYVGFAHALVENEHLSPIERGIIATWLTTSGFSEWQILTVMAGHPSPPPGPSSSTELRRVF